MKILLFGKGGRLGWELQRALAPLGELYALGSHSIEAHADFRHPVLLERSVRQFRPDVIVNAAAYANVDLAQSQVALAHALNAQAPGVLARAAAASGAWLVHYSSDYVFDGQASAPYDELAAAGPLNVYGQSKLAGEQAIRASGCQHLILRSSWLHAARGENFARSLLRLGAQRETLQVVNDQTGAPTGADLLADITAHALRVVYVRPALAGTYHATAAGCTSRLGYAQFVLDWARRQGLEVKLSAQALHGVASVDYPAAGAPRPLNSRLDCTKLCQAFGLHLPHWSVGVARLLDQAGRSWAPAPGAQP